MPKKIFLFLLASFLFSFTESNNTVIDIAKISKNKINLQNKYNRIIKKINGETDTDNDTPNFR